ncbi:MAG TPA: ABC transporter ATP-binding protein [Desulfuromonadaceae bacterium]
MTEQVLSFENLGFAYKAGRWVLRGYKGAVKRGKVLAILGPNGRGKTTLLKLLIGTLAPGEGTIQTLGRVAFVPQLFQVSFPYTVLDMVLMGRARQVGFFSTPSGQDEKTALRALERLGLADLAARPFDELSGGQRQLVIFARTLATEADILILDEPTSALDLKNQGIILEWIERLSRQEGLTVAFTTHHPHHAYAVADSTLLMLGEDDFLCGPTQEVMTEQHLHSLYGVDLKRLQFEHKGRTVETFVPVYGRMDEVAR